MPSYRLLAIALLLVVSRLCAQNLVPNPSFEATLVMGCDPFTVADFNGALTDWYTPSLGTPDLFSTTVAQTCWNFQPNSTYAGVIALRGPQLPRTGDVMAGFRTYTINGLNQREYLQVRLASPLVPCRTYTLSYYLSLSDSIEFASSNIDANLSVNAVSAGTDGVMPLARIGGSTSAVTDVTGWTHVTMTFEAQAAWEYLTIGNFNNDATTTLVPNPLSNGGVGMYGTYFFIDDVSLERVCPTVSLGPDQVLCLGDTLRLSLPSGCFDSIVWSTGASTAMIEVMDQGYYAVHAVQDTCIASDTVFVDVQVCPADVTMPNVFSPNGDGVNDTYKPMTLANVRIQSMTIYDRWGRQLFTTQNLDQGWDGKLNGNDCPESVYYYVVRYQGKDLVWAQETKSLLLIR
jgi:gliding motility-associated-like protein